MRVSIQNCVKLVIKTFYSPSMKNIIFEVIYKMLMSRDSLLLFEPAIIQQFIQTINLFGMSVDKFRRMLKVLVAEHVFSNDDFFFLYLADFKVCGKKEFSTKYQT